MSNNYEGWYNSKKMPSGTLPYKQRARTKIFRLDKFRVPSFLLCVVAACSIAFGVCNVVVASKFYFTDPATSTASTTWVGCQKTGISALAPNTTTRGNVFWIFASVGLWIGLWCFLLGIWAGYAPVLRSNMLASLSVVLLLTFIGCALQALLACLDIAAILECFDTANMDLKSNIKIAMPTFLIVFAFIQVVLTAILFSQVRSLRSFKKTQHTMTRYLPTDSRYDAQNAVGFADSVGNQRSSEGFNNRMSISQPAPYTNLQGFN